MSPALRTAARLPAVGRPHRMAGVAIAQAGVAMAGMAGAPVAVVRLLRRQPRRVRWRTEPV